MLHTHARQQASIGSPVELSTGWLPRHLSPAQEAISLARGPGLPRPFCRGIATVLVGPDSRATPKKSPGKCSGQSRRSPGMWLFRSMGFQWTSWSSIPKGRNKAKKLSKFRCKGILVSLFLNLLLLPSSLLDGHPYSGPQTMSSALLPPLRGSRESCPGSTPEGRTPVKHGRA